MVNPISIKNEHDIRRTSIAAAEKAEIYMIQKAHGLFCFNHTRLSIFALSTVCLSMVVGNSIAMNFTVICMIKPGEVYRLGNGTVNPDANPLYSSNQQSWLFSSVAVGTILGTLPISFFSHRFGVRKTFTVYGFLSALSTLLIPLSVKWGFFYVIVMRVIQGASVATSYPSMGSIVAEWATVKRMGVYVAWLSVHLQLGTIFTMPLSASFCDSRYSWPAVYYLQGGITLLCFVLFFTFYRDDAALHPMTSSKEISVLQKDKFVRVLEKGEKLPVPYRSIFTDWAVIGCIVSCFSSNAGFNVFIQFGPTYLNKVLHFDVQHTGFAAALPSIICIAVKFVAGPLSDHLPYLNAKWRVVVFATISQFSMAGCFTALAFLPTGRPVLAQCLFTGAIVFSGLNAVGVIKSCHLISGRFAYVIMAIHQFTNSLIILLLPPIVFFIAPDGTREQWARILISISVLVVVAILFFDCTARGTTRKWAIETAQPTQGPQSIHPVDIRAETLKDVVAVNHVLDSKRHADEVTQETLVNVEV
ncbi:MFS domain-containing protein [Aphelenchoides besseyi]|nr:MFS domain-containing protein [Aphelenchoides besseyi]